MNKKLKTNTNKFLIKERYSQHDNKINARAS